MKKRFLSLFLALVTLLGILPAAKAIYKRGTAYNFMAAPKLTAAPDKSIAYPVTVDGKAYQQQVFTVRSETWVFDYDVAVAFSDPASVPTGTRIVDMDNRDITAVTTEGTGEGYVGRSCCFQRHQARPAAGEGGQRRPIQGHSQRRV